MALVEQHARARACSRCSAPRIARATSSPRCVVERGLQRGFDPRSKTTPRRRRSRRPEADLERRDLRDLDTFTVDPATARDFDDAVSAAPEGDGVRLWIHIADVAAHVRPGTALDRRGAAPRQQHLRARDRSSRCCRWRCRRSPAASRRASSGSRSRPRSCSRRRGDALGELLSQPDPLRPAPRLRRARPDLRRSSAAPRSWSASRSSWHGARPRRCARAARQRRPRGLDQRAGVRVRRRRPRRSPPARSSRPRPTG